MISSRLFWVSDNGDLGEKEINPKIPQNFLVFEKAIDSKTPRILLYSNLTDAISVYGMGGGSLKGKTLSVYRPRFLHPSNRLSPTLSDSPYSLCLEGKEYWCLVPLEMIKVADIKIGKKIDSKNFRYGGSRVLKQSFTRIKTLPVYEWTEILPEWDKKGKTMKLKRKNFGSTAAKATEDKPVAREAGLIGGSALIGLGAGLSALSAAERLDKAAEIKGQTKKSWAEWEHEKRRETAKKYIDKHAPAEKKKEVLEKTMKKLKKIEKKELEDIEKSTKRFRKITKPVSKFAETKGGKATLIGIPTAVIGGVVYKSAKKKMKSDKKEGEAK